MGVKPGKQRGQVNLTYLKMPNRPTDALLADFQGFFCRKQGLGETNKYFCPGNKCIYEREKSPLLLPQTASNSRCQTVTCPACTLPA